MPESDFVEVIINELEKYIPAFADVYYAEKLRNEPRDMMELKNKLKVLAEKGKLIVEPKVMRAHEEETIATKNAANRPSNDQYYEEKEEQK
jgi:hypothetical protein